MKKVQIILGGAAFALSFGVAAHSMKVSVELSFNNDPVCKAVDQTGKMVAESKGGKVYNEDEVSWSSSCEVSLPDSIRNCVMQGQSMQQSAVIDSWGSKYTGKSIKASMTSDSDINPTYGRYSVSYYCH